MTIQEFLEFRRQAIRGKLDEYYESLNVHQKLEAIKCFEKIGKEKVSKYENSIYSNYNVITDVEQMVLGQFIMVEQVLQSQSDTSELQVLNLIVRPKEDKEFEYTDMEREQMHSMTVAQLDAVDGMQVFQDFMDSRQEVLFNKFKGVVYQEQEENEAVDEDEEKEEDTSTEERFSKMWYWYSIIRDLAGEDILKQDQVTMLKMSKVLVELSFKAQKSRIEYARMRREEAMRRR
jgi:hypothetical protein